MDVADLLHIATAGIDDRRVEMATVEPTGIATEAVSGLAQILAELAENAVAFSDPGDRVRVAGLFTHDDYLITISDHGVGIPESMIALINRQLEDPSAVASDPATPTMGIQLVARLAHRLGIGVKLVPAVPGTTARVTIPARYLSRDGESPRSPWRDDDGDSGIFNPMRARPDVSERPAEELTVDLTSYESRRRSPEHVVAMTETARAEAEQFLAEVFGPLLTKPRSSERPASRADKGGNEHGPVEQAPRPDRGERLATTTTLRVRVPGENFEVTQDEPSTASAEGAIDIRSALSRYQEGRRSAERRDR
ncbi:MAG TPA: ATP-binding protein [Acidimicrobiia bacterium]|jgi:anti-sigma regulatory factor (Ser/Thr protein kinase)|nr:ATP-binding protein [Acidimicrobiia bacterium]